MRTRWRWSRCAPGLKQVDVDDDLVVMGMLADRRDELGRARTQTVNRLHRLLLELFPGGAKQFLSAHQARALIATIKPRDLVGQDPPPARGRADRRARGDRPQDQGDRRRNSPRWSTARGSTLLELHGIGPSGAARLLADVGDIHRFADRDRFASWNGTAPLDASSGNQNGTGSPAPATGASTAPAHHGRRPTPQPRPKAAPTTTTESRRHALDDGDARTQTTTVQRRLRPHARRPETTRGSGPGWALGDDSALQRDRPDPGHRLFGKATSRTRHHKPRTAVT